MAEHKKKAPGLSQRTQKMGRRSRKRENAFRTLRSLGQIRGEIDSLVIDRIEQLQKAIDRLRKKEKAPVKRPRIPKERGA